ncbi:hypothetical protein BJX76DRAFT_348736 [Aspergillus varians]
MCSSDLAANILLAESHIWRRLFKDTYDESVRRTATDYKIEYQIRAFVLSRPADFGYGQREKQTYWLELLRELILEGLFQEAKQAVTYLALDPSMAVRCLCTDYDIGAVYAFPDKEFIIADDYTVSTENALHILNFWVRHLLNPDEACICPTSTLTDLENRQTCADSNGHMVEVEHITIQLEEHADPQNWPDIFEQYVCEFSGWNNETRTFFPPVRVFIDRIYGGGIRGRWLRISFVVYEPSHPQQEVVAPGGSLMVGHWWDPRADDDSAGKGPFIFWCML